MLVSLSLTSFRGIENTTLSLGKKTYIMGENGSGKTHILDALHLVSGAKILYGTGSLEVGSQIESLFREHDLTKSYRMIRDEAREFFAIQGGKLSKPKYMNALPWRTVHISPFDMNLLYFAPGMRREYIDSILARTYEQFHIVERNYENALRQRNALLKKIKEGISKKEELSFWDAKFAECADIYGLYREKYRDFVQASLAGLPQFFGKYPLNFEYRSSWIDKDERPQYIIAYLKENQERDVITGHTHIGPHRDDWGFVILDNEHEPIPAESYLSRGEMKMLLLGLKMIETTFISKTLGLPTILLIDDIFAELDEKNSHIFLGSLTTYQVILTSQKPLPGEGKWEDFICINLKDM